MTRIKLFSALSISSIWISFVSAFGPAFLCISHGDPINLVACVVVLLTTFAVYSLDKASGSVEDLTNTPGRAVLANYPIKQLAILSYLLAVCIVVIEDIWKLPCVLVFGFAGVIYTARIMGVRPKDLPGIKNLIVAASSAICYAGLVSGSLGDYALVGLAIFIDTVLFDLRDVSGDRLVGIRTLPVVLGRRNTLWLLVLLDLLLYSLSPIVAIIGIFLIIYFRNERHSLSYDYLVDPWLMWSFACLRLLQWAHIVWF